MSERLKRGYHHGDLKTALRNAAIEALDEAGVDAVTIRDVARRAGVAHSAPANHFKDRKALLTDLAAGITGDLAQALQSALAKDGDQRVRLKAAMSDVLGYALAYPHRYRLANRHDVLDCEHGALAEAQQKIFDVLAAIVGRGGQAEPADGAPLGLETRVFAAWSLVHGYVSLRLDGTLTQGVDEISGAPREAALIDALMDGLN